MNHGNYVLKPVIVSKEVLLACFHVNEGQSGQSDMTHGVLGDVDSFLLDIS